MTSARTGPAASVYPAVAAADAVMKLRRDNGAVLVSPTASGVHSSSAVDILFPSSLCTRDRHVTLGLMTRWGAQATIVEMRKSRVRIAEGFRLAQRKDYEMQNSVKITGGCGVAQVQCGLMFMGAGGGGWRVEC
jgi:hypothetical protein